MAFGLRTDLLNVCLVYAAPLAAAGRGDLDCDGTFKSADIDRFFRCLGGLPLSVR